MAFKSIEDVRQEFGLADTEPSELKRQLRKLQASLHPDRYGRDDFVSKEDKEKFLSIEAAIEFLDSYGKEKGEQTALIPITTVKALVEILREMIPDNKQNIEIGAETQFAERIAQRISEIKSRSLFPKITVSAITGVLTALWAFPSIVSEHPVLRQYIDVASPYFAMAWISSVVVMALTWYLSKVIETQEKDLKSRLKTETFQNQLFREFLRSRIEVDWDRLRREAFNLMIQLSHDQENDLNRLILEFEEALSEIDASVTLDDPLHFATVGFKQPLQRILEKAGNSVSVEHLSEIAKDIRITKDDFVAFLTQHQRQKEVPITRFGFFINELLYLVMAFPRRLKEILFGNPNEIDLELAQSLADIVFTRLEKKGLIVRDKQQSLSEAYTLHSE